MACKNERLTMICFCLLNISQWTLGLCKKKKTCDKKSVSEFNMDKDGSTAVRPGLWHSDYLPSSVLFMFSC